MTTTENQTDDLAFLASLPKGIKSTNQTVVTLTDEMSDELIFLARFIIQTEQLTGVKTMTNRLESFLHDLQQSVNDNYNHALILTREEAAFCAERAYRRGFQQGVTFALTQGVTEEDALKFRYVTPYDKPYGAPEKPSNGDRVLTNPHRTLEDVLMTENKQIFERWKTADLEETEH